MKLGVRYLWFKLALVLGSLLGLWLLVSSVRQYYLVSQNIIRMDLRREAQGQTAALEQEARQQEIQDPGDLSPLLAQAIKDAPKKIAWIRILDAASGKTLAQAGKPVGPPISLEGLRASFGPGAGPGGLTPGSGPPTYEIRNTEAGKVLVTPVSLRLFRRPDANGMGFRGGPDFGRVPEQTAARGTVQAPARGQGRTQAPVQGQVSDGRPAESQPPGQGQGPGRGQFGGPRRFAEIALYLDSANSTYGRLLTSLIVNSSAALGLVASMVLLWLRFPSYVKGKHLEQQTELARQVQMDLLPPANSVVEKLDFAAECVPAWQVGGDFYDVFSNDEGRVALCLGDVSGKGLPASVVVGLLLGAVRASDWLRGSEEIGPASSRLNELLRARTSVERFASLFWCYYDPQKGLLRYINAGHLPPMVAKRNGAGGPVIERLEEGGPVLGVIPGAQYNQGVTSVAPGDLMVMYSDGVVEATNSADEQFGEERLLAVIRGNSEKSAVEIRDEILRHVNTFLEKEQAQDDLTLVVARIRG